MRVAVLGAGGMGARAAATLADLPGIDGLLVADRDARRAADLAGRLADRRAGVTARRLDVTDGPALRALLAEVDLVLSTVGPFYRYDVAVLRAAIETGTGYVDICDDWEPTVELLDLDADVRRAGVCAVVGAGASPGLSTLLAAEATARLDAVRHVYTAWPVDAGTSAAARGDDGDLTAGAAAVHWMHQCSGRVAEIRDGTRVHRRPLRPVPLQLPGGRSGTGYTVGHPEPITLSRTVSPTGDAACLMLLRPGTAAYLDVLRRAIDSGALTPEDAAGLLGAPSALRVIRSLPGGFGRYRRSAGDLPAFFAAADGTADGAPRRVLARLESPAGGGLFADMAAITGVPAALIAVQLVDGPNPPGVHPPDAIVDRPGLFGDLAVAFPGTRIVVEEEPGCLTA